MRLCCDCIVIYELAVHGQQPTVAECLLCVWCSREHLTVFYLYHDIGIAV